MTPEQRLKIASVVSGLLGFSEGVYFMARVNLGDDMDLARDKTNKEPYFERARELLKALEAGKAPTNEN